MTMQDQRTTTAMLMEPISEIDEHSLDNDGDTKLKPSTTMSTSDVDREHSDIIKVKNVCKCLINWYQLMLSKLIGCIYAQFS